MIDIMVGKIVDDDEYIDGLIFIGHDGNSGEKWIIWAIVADSLTWTLQPMKRKGRLIAWFVTTLTSVSFAGRAPVALEAPLVS